MKWKAYVVRTVSRGRWSSSAMLPVFAVEASCEQDARAKVRDICPDYAGARAVTYDIEVSEL